MTTAPAPEPSIAVTPPIELEPDGTHWTLVNVATGERIRLRPRIGRLIRYMLDRPGLTLAKAELHDHVCPHASLHNNNVDVAVLEARFALKRLGVGPIIRTNVGAGYILDFNFAGSQA